MQAIEERFPEADASCRLGDDGSLPDILAKQTDTINKLLMTVEINYTEYRPTRGLEF